VTTLHDPSNDTTSVFAASELQRAGRVVGPRIFSTGTILYGAAAPFKAEINSLEDARSHLRRLKAIGAFSVKSYNQPRREQRQQVLAAARELGMMVVPEGGSLFQHNMTMVVDGHTGVEHAIPVAAAYADVMQLWGATKVGYTPTLGVAYGGLSARTTGTRTRGVAGPADAPVRAALRGRPARPPAHARGRQRLEPRPLGERGQEAGDAG
jgi:hypothetical protein